MAAVVQGCVARLVPEPLADALQAGPAEAHRGSVLVEEVAAVPEADEHTGCRQAGPHQQVEGQKTGFEQRHHTVVWSSTTARECCFLSSHRAFLISLGRESTSQGADP